jgi:hypothetical protein
VSLNVPAEACVHERSVESGSLSLAESIFLC